MEKTACSVHFCEIGNIVLPEHPKLPPVKCAPSNSSVPPAMAAVAVRIMDRALPSPSLYRKSATLTPAKFHPQGLKVVH